MPAVEVVAVVVVLVVAGVAAGEAPDACTTSTGALPEAVEAGADGSAAAGLVAGAGEPGWASVKDNVLSNAAAAQLNRFRELAIIIMMQKREMRVCLKQEADHPVPTSHPLFGLRSSG